jgi:hypothetical protein
VNGPVPAVTFTDAEPVLEPLQFTLPVTDAEIEGPPAFETAAVAVAVHPLASVTVTVYDPAARLFAVEFVPPLGLHM